MRLGVSATVVSLCLVGLCGAQTSHASIRKDLNVPAEALSPALQTVGTTYELQVLYPTAIVKDLKTPGASGSLTPEEALTRVLAGTGLSYKYLDANTVTVFAASQAAASPSQPSSAVSAGDGTKNKEDGKKSSQEFRVAQAASGQAAGPASLASASAQESTSQAGTIQEVIVTAQKREERLKDVPISLSVLNGNQLAQPTIQSVTEALTTVPGVSAFPFNQGGGTFIAIRGVTASYPVFGGSSPIAYYLDGVPFGLVDTAIAPDTNAYDLSRVEVLRGPQGTLYGASALNGVVRVLTNDADLNDFEVQGRASGSHTTGTELGGGNFQGDMLINAPVVPGELGVRLDVGYQSLAGWIDNAKTQDVNDAVLRNIRLKVNAQPTDELSIGLSMWSSRQDYGAPSIANEQGQTTHDLPEEPISTDYGAYGLKVGYKLSAVSITSTTSYLNYASHDTWDYGADFLPFSYPIFERFDAHVFSEELNVSSIGEGPWRWTAGAIYRSGENRTYQTLPSIVALDWIDGSKSYAVFGEITRLFFGGKLEWTVGGRYFHDDVTTREGAAATTGLPGYVADASFNSTTPRSVLAWHPSKDELLYASYSEGFRSGAPQPYYITGGVPGFPAVKPDKLHNYEIGTKTDFLEHRLSVDAAVYYMDWRDVQQQLSVPFQNTFVTAVVNGQSASGLGTDLGVTVEPISKLKLRGDISWNDLTVDSDVFSNGQVLFAKGDRLSFSAKYTAGGSVDYSVPFGKGFSGEVNASYNYSSALTERGIVPGVGAVRAATGDSMSIARASLILHAPQNWDISVFADNFTNWQGAVYRSALSSNPDTSVRVRPRTIGAQLQYRY